MMFRSSLGIDIQAYGSFSYDISKDLIIGYMQLYRQR